MVEKCTGNPRDCPLTARVEALEKANEVHSETHREIFRRVGNLESMTAVQDTQLKNIDEKLDEIKENDRAILAKVEALEAKPGDRWETLVGCLFSTGVGAFWAWLAMGMPGVGG